MYVHAHLTLASEEEFVFASLAVECHLLQKLAHFLPLYTEKHKL